MLNFQTKPFSTRLLNLGFQRWWKRGMVTAPLPWVACAKASQTFEWSIFFQHQLKSSLVQPKAISSSLSLVSWQREHWEWAQGLRCRTETDLLQKKQILTMLVQGKQNENQADYWLCSNQQSDFLTQLKTTDDTSSHLGFLYIKVPFKTNKIQHNFCNFINCTAQKRHRRQMLHRAWFVYALV